jgi:hypothetical protein
MDKVIILLIILIVIKFVWFNKEGFECDNLAPNACNTSEECEWIRRECRNISSNSC